jgi:hypothetical protein
MEHLTSMWHWEPASPGKNPLNKCCKQGRMDVKPAKDFIAANTAFRSGLGYVLNLTAKQEAALAEFLKNYKGKYDALYNNCGDPVLVGLRALGFHLSLPEGPIMGLPPLVITPDDLDYALGHTKGLVTGWVPYPQQTNPKK